MYQTAAPVLTRASDRKSAAPLRLARIAHREFAPGSTRIDDAFSERHFTDITGAYGVDYRPELAATGAGNTFAAMTRALVESLDLSADGVDLAVVAHATPDLDCRAAAATYLSDAWPHGPLAFGLSEQGCCAPFTALRLAGAYARRHGHRQVLVLALDQATLPYPTGRTLTGDAGVALLLTEDGTLGLPQTRILPGVSTAELGGLLADRLPAGDSATVLAGPGIDPERDLPERLRRQPGLERTGPGFPASGLWNRLARQPHDRTVVLVDRDPDTGDVGLCTRDRTPEGR
jgi:hypothetical protein